MKRTVYRVLLLALVCLLGAAVFSACGKQVAVRLQFMVEGEVYATVDTTVGEVIAMPQDPTAAGLVFDGWYWDEGAWQRPFTAGSMLDVPLSGGSYSVYAKWIAPATAPAQTIAGPAEAKIVSAPDFTFSDMRGTVSVANATDLYSFIGKIRVSEGAAWQLSTDVYGREDVPTKTVPLAVGDNLFYLLVTSENGETLTLYTINVRRRPIYTLTFDTNGGTPAASVNVEEDTVLAAPQTSRTGYTLAGWDYDFAVPITASRTVRALWTANTYTVTLDANGGTVSPQTLTVTFDAAFTLPTPVKTGHTFAGWYLGSAPFSEGVWTRPVDTTLTAVWSVNSYTLTLQKSIAAAGTVTGGGNKEYGASVTVGVTATNADYTWLGWYDTAGACLTTAPQYTFTMGFDATLIATWIPFAVSCGCSPAGGGTITGMPNGTYAGQSVTLTAVTHIGYVWQGWYRNGQFVTSNEQYTFTVPAAAADGFSLTAAWSVSGEMQAYDFVSTATACTLTGVHNTAAAVIALPDCVTAIGAGAFAGCSSLTTLYIPENVTSIGAGALSGCGALRSVWFGGQTEQWNAVSKAAGWDTGAGNYRLYCTDEDVAQDAFS